MTPPRAERTNVSETDRIDAAITAMNRISLLAQLRDKITAAMQTDRKECGSCQDWMKSGNCPRETLVNDRWVGPSMKDAGCNQFRVERYILELKANRIAEAVAFAKFYGLPAPPLPIDKAAEDGT